jgi:hypothetical protein
MFQLVKTLTIPQLLIRQMPTLMVSFVIAELFYKFHSFTLECAAFLATWFALDAAVQVVAPQRTGAPAKEAK